MDSAARSMIHERENDWPRSILVLLGGSLIALAFLFFNWVREHSPASVLFDKIANFSQPGLITDSYTIVERNQDSNLAGSAVLLNPARVESVLGDYAFIINLGRGQTLPVFLLGEMTGRQSEEQVRIEPGQSLYIFGFLLPTHGLDQLINPEFIDESEKLRLLMYPRYISAMHVVVLSAP